MSLKEDLDVLIAVHIFKLSGLNPVPYSTETGASQLVWDKMTEQSPDIYQKFLDGMPSFIAREVERGRSIEFLCQVIPPVEICLAALAVLMPSTVQ